MELFMDIFMAIKKIYWTIIIKRQFRKLKKKYPVNYSVHLKIVHLSREGNCYRVKIPKALSTVRVHTTHASINICLENHINLSDVLDSLYHEYRHIMQYDLVDTKYILLWSRLAKINDKYYSISPIEIDARIFAKTRGINLGREVFNDFGSIDDFQLHGSYICYCLERSKYYTRKFNL
jgi:hypothetical protein